MSSETEIILAFIFKRSGKPRLSFSEGYLALSMDLNWFTPKDAKEFVNKAINNKLLIKKGEEILPNFNYKKIIIPVGFTPSKQVFEENVIEYPERKEEKLLEKIVKYLINKTELDSQQIREKIRGISKTNNITVAVAAAVLAKEHNVAIEDFNEEIENNIFTENKG
jgi:hypothetical protein